MFFRGSLLFIFVCAFIFSGAPAYSSDVIVIGDTQLKPVVGIVSGIRETLGMHVKVYAPADVQGRLKEVAAKENAKVVVALGKDALEDALQLPPSIAVIYDLIIAPPVIDRRNTTGVYMATPTSQYVDLVNAYLPSINKIAAIGSRGLMKILDNPERPQVVSYTAKSPFEFVSALQRLETADAILLIPDVSLLTASALEEVYLFSFRKGIPILGLSEKYVKQGALLALVYDPAEVGRQIGERARSSLNGTDMGTIPPSPAREFHLYVNAGTAKKLGIRLSAELLRKAEKIYQ